jgi:hypothetical protein
MLCDYQHVNSSLSEDALEEAKAAFLAHAGDTKTRSLEVLPFPSRNYRRCCMR